MDLLVKKFIEDIKADSLALFVMHKNIFELLYRRFSKYPHCCQKCYGKR